MVVESIYWMGVALSVGVIISLFVTAVVHRALVHLVFDAAQERLSEHGWLLGT
jgi:predicted RND superfamily exporter protein